jgi:hypothetical protein
MRPASSFSNKISDKYDDRPKRRGPQVGGGIRGWRLNQQNAFLTPALSLSFSPSKSSYI